MGKKSVSSGWGEFEMTVFVVEVLTLILSLKLILGETNRKYHK
jgi:hypothetical protein